uniref:Uncharacterized protein n=1 Tax=Ixodes ricinus TaxID=34613 RepID=A0A6B0V3C2_IXORI
MRPVSFLCIIAMYRIMGVSPLRSFSEEDFIDKVIYRTQQELNRRLQRGLVLYLRPNLLSDDGTSISLGETAFAKALGIGYKFRRTGECSTGQEHKKKTLQCPVRFNCFRIVLPQLPEDGGTQYVVRVTVVGEVVLWDPTGGPFLSYRRFKKTAETTYTMTNSHGIPVTSYPARYSLLKGRLLNLRGILESRLNAFFDDGTFRDAISAVLRVVNKPADFSSQ